MSCVATIAHRWAWFYDLDITNLGDKMHMLLRLMGRRGKSWNLQAKVKTKNLNLRRNLVPNKRWSLWALWVTMHLKNNIHKEWSMIYCLRMLNKYWMIFQIFSWWTFKSITTAEGQIYSMLLTYFLNHHYIICLIIEWIHQNKFN